MEIAVAIAHASRFLLSLSLSLTSRWRSWEHPGEVQADLAVQEVVVTDQEEHQDHQRR